MSTMGIEINENGARESAQRYADYIVDELMPNENFSKVDVVEALIHLYILGYYNGVGKAMIDNNQQDEKVYEYIKGMLAE